MNIEGPAVDYQLLFSTYTAVPAHARWSRQRQLHECLRSAIRSGTLGSGARLPATRTLAHDLGVSRNTVLYAYDQLATEGFVLPDRRGTVVTGAAARTALPAPAAMPLRMGLSRRALAVPSARCTREHRRPSRPVCPRSRSFRPRYGGA